MKTVCTRLMWSGRIAILLSLIITLLIWTKEKLIRINFTDTAIRNLYSIQNSGKFPQMTLRECSFQQLGTKSNS